MSLRCLVFPLAALTIFAGCIPSPDHGEGAAFGSPISVIPPEGTRMKGIETLAVWKGSAEAKAKFAPAAAERDYEVARQAVNSWLENKKAEGNRKALQLTAGFVDLGPTSIDELRPMVDRFEDASGSQLETGPGTAAGVALAGRIIGRLIEAGKQNRTESAAALATQLDGLKWRPWSEVRG